MKLTLNLADKEPSFRLCLGYRVFWIGGVVCDVCQFIPSFRDSSLLCVCGSVFAFEARLTERREDFGPYSPPDQNRQQVPQFFQRRVSLQCGVSVEWIIECPWMCKVKSVVTKRIQRGRAERPIPIEGGDLTRHGTVEMRCLTPPLCRKHRRLACVCRNERLVSHAAEDYGDTRHCAPPPTGGYGPTAVNSDLVLRATRLPSTQPH